VSGTENPEAFPLPTHHQISMKIREAGTDSLTAVERFIHNNEPKGLMDEIWRGELLAALEEWKAGS
jgi:hypothetical protein